MRSTADPAPFCKAEYTYVVLDYNKKVRTFKISASTTSDT